MARYFSQEVGIFESWYIRLAISAVLMLMLFHRKIDFKKFRRIGKKDWSLLVFRALAASLLGTLLCTLSTCYTSIGAVAAMQVVPMTAIFGVIILGEKLNRRNTALIALAFVGALMVVMRSTSDIGFGLGELLSLASAALFSLTFVLRKLQTNLLNDMELAFVATIVAFLGNYLFASVFEQAWLVDTSQFTPTLMLLFIGGGLASALTWTLSNYGLSQVRATTASVILNLELVFGAFMGYLLYKEILSPLQFVGATIILIAVIGMSYLETQSKVDG